MISFLLRWAVTALAVWVAVNVVDGVSYTTKSALAVAALLLGIANALLRPLLLVITFLFSAIAFGPIIAVLSFGVAVLVINALLFWGVGYVVKDFRVDGFWAAFFGSLIVSVVSLIFNSFLVRKGRVTLVRPPPREPPPANDDVIDV